MPSRLTVAVIALALLATVRPGFADDEEALLRTQQSVSELAPDARPTSFSPVHSVRAEAFPKALIEFFGETIGFSDGERLSVFELEGGAALRVLSRLRLTASYRMLGSEDSEARGASLPLAQHLAAPYLGIALDF